MLYSELYKIMMSKVTSVGFRGAFVPIAPLDPSLLVEALLQIHSSFFSHIVNLRGFPLSAVTVSLHYLQKMSGAFNGHM